MDLDTIAIMKDEFDKHSADHLLSRRRKISFDHMLRIGREFFGWIPTTSDRMDLSQEVGDEIDFVMFLVIMNRAQASMWRNVEQHMENGFAALGSDHGDTIPLSQLAVTLESFAGMDRTDVRDVFGTGIDEDDPEIRSLISGGDRP